MLVNIPQGVTRSRQGSHAPPGESILVAPLQPMSPEVDLPRRDGGREAWALLVSVSCILMISWGFGSASGVFREYYFNHEPTKGNQLVASIGVMIVGVLQAMSPFLLHYLSGRQHHRKPMMWCGMVLLVTSTIVAAFSQTPLQVIMTQGLLYGIGSGFLFAPSVSFIDEWFLERRGFANGLFFGSNNIAAAAFSPVLSILLKRFGPRTVLLGWAVLACCVITVGILLVRPRLQHYDEKYHQVSLRPLKKPIFWLFTLSMILQGLANFLPAAYLPSYATDLGVSVSDGALLITYLSLSGMIGQTLLGLLTDKVGALLPLFLSTLVSTFAVVILWGFGQHYWLMVLLAILFGAFSFSFVVLRSHMATAVVGDFDHPNDELVVSGALLATRGAAAVVSGYMGAGVLSTSEHKGIQPGYGAGKWRSLIITLGCLMFGATIAFMGFIGKRGKKADALEKTRQPELQDVE